MRWPLPLAATLACCTFPGLAHGQQTSTVRIYIEHTVQRLNLEFRVVGQRPQRVGPQPIETNGYFRIYQHVVTWPVLGSIRRDDFRLTAKLQAGIEGRTLYLRLRPASTPVDIYMFSRPAVTQCRWADRPRPTTLEGIYRQLAEAEAMLLIKARQGRCGIVNMQNWTRRWAELTLLLWDENKSVASDPEVTSAIEWAHENPIRPFLSFARGAVPLPREYERARTRERQLASQFN